MTDMIDTNGKVWREDAERRERDEARLAAFLDLAIRAADQHAEEKPSGWGPETMSEPYADGNGLKGGNHSHGGHSSLILDFPESGTHMVQLTLPEAAWTELCRRPPERRADGRVVIKLIDVDWFHPVPITLQIDAFGDWEQAGLADAMRDAWRKLCRCNYPGRWPKAD